MNFFDDLWAEHKGKIIGIICGVIAAIIILVFGFFKFLFILFCGIIGYLIGKVIDNRENIRDIIDRIFPPDRW